MGGFVDDCVVDIRCVAVGRGEFNVFRGAGLGSGGIGGGGTAFVGEVSDVAALDDSEDRRADAGTVGCEKGFPGPLGASVNV